MLGLFAFGLSIVAPKVTQSVKKSFFSTPEQTQELIVQAIESGQDNIAVAQQNNEGLIDVTIIDIPTFIKQSGVGALNSLFHRFNFNSNTAIVIGSNAQVQQFANNLSIFNPMNWGSALAFIQNTVSSAKPPRHRKAIASVDLAVGGGAISPELRAAIAQTISTHFFRQVPSQVASDATEPLVNSRHISNASRRQIAAAPTEHHDEALDPALDPFPAFDLEEANSSIHSLESVVPFITRKPRADEPLSLIKLKAPRTRSSLTDVPIEMFEPKPKHVRPTATVLSGDDHRVNLDDHVAELTQLITSMLLFSTSTPKLKPKHRDAINTCVHNLRDATEAFMRAPSPATFAAFKDVSVAKIKAMETVLSHQPMIWKMLKPICNALIRTMNAIKKMIWTNPKVHSLFNNKSEAQLAWEATRRRPTIMQQLEQIRRVVEGDEAPTPNSVLGGSSQ